VHFGAIVRRDGDLIRSPQQVAPGDRLSVRVAEGSFGAVVETAAE